MTKLEYLEERLAETEKQIAEEEQIARNRKAAEDLYDLYDTFLSVGFDEEQAWWLTRQMFTEALCTSNE